MSPGLHRPDNISPGRKPFGWAPYWVLVLAVGAVLTVLNKLQVFGGVIDRTWFNVFRYTLHFHVGVFGCAVLTSFLYLLRRWRIPAFLRIAVFASFFIWFIWVVVWVLVRRAFGIELLSDILWELLTNRAAIAAVGLGETEFALGVGTVVLLGTALGLLSDRISQRSNERLLRTGCVSFVLVFALVHLSLRLHARFHENAKEHVIVAYHDYVPSFLHVMQANTGPQGDRPALPTLESRTRTTAYFDPKRTEQMPAIPRPRNIVWINIESFRFDAIDEQTMPRLMAYADHFQVRLQHKHWSGGNATQFGIFSQLTGLSGYHLHHLSRANMPDPFLTLLGKNGYRLRVAKKKQLKYIGLSVLLPPGTVEQDVGKGSQDVEDRRMIDRYLEDRAARPAGTFSFDFIAFDATHWPYPFPREHAIFQPAPPLNGSQMILGFPEELEFVRNRYRNACHFVDEQIARVLDDLRARNELDSTLVVILGDHGEEFEERGQITHAAVLNDFQARTPLWMHLPDAGPGPLRLAEVPTTHLDVVPTILEAFGFEEDVLFTQGRSLLSALEDRPVLCLSDTGFRVPLYRTLVTGTYISRWAQRPLQYLFAGVQRRDGGKVEGEEWLREARLLNSEAAAMFELLPDVSQPPRKFDGRNRP
jgi:membrane-anchored protein YejM (alkaline phosphatase superfamily)